MVRAEDAVLVREKVEQAAAILREEGIDCWMLLARESDVLGDPSLPFIAGTSVTWESAFVLTGAGERYALVGTADVPNVESVGAWPEVIGYVEGISGPLRALLERLDPAKIALNFAPGNYMADGLTYGMWLNVQRWLTGTPFLDRVVSGEPIVTKLRGRKSPAEQARIRRAVATTVEIWQALQDWLRPGATEREIAAYMHDQCARRGVETSWDHRYCPTVTAGPDSPVGHTEPTEIKLRPGHLLAIDFGVRQDDYVSDMQRTFYILRDGESEPPQEVRDAFGHVAAAIQLGAAELKPGVAGWEVDDVVRGYFEKHELPEWRYGVGHQMGRAAHDGGALLGPRWERYGNTPFELIEPDQIYTLEIGFPLPGYGFLVAEEDVLVRPDGIEWLAPPQRELIVIGSR
jgi:Xaa-Pro aminopeptidase